MKLYVLCYRTANELRDIRVSTDIRVALELLETHKKSKQVLEYDVVNGITEESPVFAYYFENDELVKYKL
jgi:hypothetical protein